ncbi:MAG: hypothetical protein WCF67_02975 [Chitinophagaceae bacterium]
MRFEVSNIYHVYNQGNNHQRIFHDDRDYIKFLDLCNSYLIPYCNMLAWNLLPNHFHLMLEANEQCAATKKQGGLLLDPLTNGFRKLLSAHSHRFNKIYNRSGALFRPKTKSKNLLVRPGVYLPENDYCLNCFCYVHQNPVRHRLVASLGDWPFSSYHFYAGANDKDFCNKNIAMKLCGFNDENFVRLIHERVPQQYAHLFEREVAEMYS